MEIIREIADSAFFWAAWLIIPFIMEIIPSIGSVFVLIKKHIKNKEFEKPAIDPEITIMIPVYNSEDTLEECLASVHESDYPDSSMRIFVINNQGSDKSFEVFSHCQEKYPSLRMQWMNSMQGKSRALNLALFNSRGKYIINIDSDGYLEKSAIRNVVTYLENNQELDCVTGTILTDPGKISKYKTIRGRLLRKLEFLEYAQAFLAGRSYAAEGNVIYTLSGAFSIFRKSFVLKSQLYNTDTICEDTELTFQARYLQNARIGVCENAIFFVDPIESPGRLYTQRQRWQRGSLEVSHMFLSKKMKVKNMFRDTGVRTLLYDHTFAFPRIIWYLILFCLMLMNYSPVMLILALILQLIMYIIINYFYFISSLVYLRPFRSIHDYYRRLFYLVPLMPVYNMAIFFIRFAGIINSIGSKGVWSARTPSEERADVRAVFLNDFKKIRNVIKRIRQAFNDGEEKLEEKTSA